MPDYLDEEDVSEVVCRLKRATPEARARLANDRATRAFIAAGASLIRLELAAHDEDVGEEARASRKLFRWLSQRAVIAEAQRIGEVDANDAKLRDRWKNHGDFIADLVSYMLWSERLSLDVTQSRLASKLLETGDPERLVEHVHEVAYSDLTAMLATASYRFQLVAAATASDDPVLESALRGMYEVILSSWSRAYEGTLAAVGLRLRPDVTMRDIANILAAVAEGLGVHLLSDPSAPVKDDNTRRSLLGTAALSVMVSCTTYGGDKRALEEVVRDMIKNKSSHPKSDD